MTNSNARSQRVVSAAAMQALGERLGARLRVGDGVALVGPLGAGKTTFVQGLARGMGVAGDRHVASPTFALVNEHPGRTPLVHADFYRGLYDWTAIQRHQVVRESQLRRLRRSV